MQLGILHGEGVVAATVGGGVEHGACNHVQHLLRNWVRIWRLFVFIFPPFDWLLGLNTPFGNFWRILFGQTRLVLDGQRKKTILQYVQY